MAPSLSRFFSALQLFTAIPKLTRHTASEDVLLHASSRSRPRQRPSPHLQEEPEPGPLAQEARVASNRRAAQAGRPGPHPHIPRRLRDDKALIQAEGPSGAPASHAEVGEEHPKAAAAWKTCCDTLRSPTALPCQVRASRCRGFCHPPTPLAQSWH